MFKSTTKDDFTAESMSVEETNALRRSLGLAPLSETVEPVEDSAVSNFKAFKAKKMKEEERRSIQERIQRARETRETQTQFTGKGLGEVDENEGDLDLRSWVMNHRKRDFSLTTNKNDSSEMNTMKRQKKINEAKYTSDQLEGIKVSHDLTDIGGESMILTLKDSTILENEDQGDELENIGLVEKEKLQKNLENKKKFVYTGYDDDEFDQEKTKTILPQYDEKVKKGFVIGNISEVPQDETWKKNLQETFSLNHTPVENVSSDYQDASEIVIKKVKKKKTNRVRAIHHDLTENTIDMKPVTENSSTVIPKENLNFDNVSFVDDDDLQACLARQREASRRKKLSQPENISKLVKQQILEELKDNDKEDEKGLVIDETTEFVRGIQASVSKIKPKTHESIEYVENSEVYLQDTDKKDFEDGVKEDPYEEPSEHMKNISTTGIEDEADITSGVGAVFNLLKQKGIVDKQTEETLSIQRAQHEHALFLLEQKKLRRRLEEEARHRKEMDRCNGKLDRMTPRERELYLQAENQRHAMIEARELQKLFANWTPVVQLKYNDEFGREIKEKEAYKFLSHQFHGKGSGKAKVDERLRKLAEEKKREQQSIFSYNR